MTSERGSIRWLWAALAATFLAYAGALAYPFVYDDMAVILNNPRITSWHYFPSYFTSHVWAHIPVGLQANYYRPTFMAWMLLTQTFGGLEPWVWHFSTLLLHIVTTCLVFRLALRLMFTVPISAMAALFFGLHPVHIESVAWVCGSTDPIMAIFLVLFFMAYLDFVEAEKFSWSALLRMDLFLLIALWSKETAIVMPAICAAHAWLLVDRTRLTRTKAIAWVLHSGTITLVYLLLRVHALGGLSNTMQQASWNVVLMSAPGVLWDYLRTLLLPFPLSLFYATTYVHSVRAPEFWQPLLGILFLAFVFWCLVHNATATKKRWAWFGCLAIFVPLALPIYTIAFFGDGDIVHDRYTYVSSIAFCILLAEGVNRLSERFTEFHRPEVAGLPTEHTRWFGLSVPTAVLAILIATMYFIGTSYQKQQWSSNGLLYSHAIAVSRTSALAYVQMGEEFNAQGDNASAVNMYEHAFQVNPNSYLASFMLANERRNAGRLPESEQLLRHAIALDDRNPTVEYRLAQVEMLQNHVQDAESTLRAAIARWPDAPALHYALGIILKSQGKLPEAKAAFQREQQISPNDSSSRNELKAME